MSVPNSVVVPVQMVMPIRAAHYSSGLQVAMTEYPETNVSTL